MAATGGSTADDEQIRAVTADRAAAMRDRDDDRFVACYAPQITKFDLAPPLAHEGPEARDAGALRAWFASHLGGPVGYGIRDLAVTVGGDVAFCHSLYQVGGALWFRSTLRPPQDRRRVADHARAQLDPVLHGRPGQGGP